MTDEPRTTDQPVVKKILSWSARQDEDGSGEITMRFSDGAVVRQWADFLAELWADG